MVMSPSNDGGTDDEKLVPLDAWVEHKLGQAFALVGSGTTPDTNNLAYYTGDIPWVTTSELRESTILETSKTVSHEALRSHSALKLYPPGTLLIAMYGATIGRLGILGIDACTNQACCALANPKTLDTRFTYYWLQAFRQDIIRLALGGGQPNINQKTIRDLVVAAPSIGHQVRIARFLDGETEKIDALVTEQRRLIELLKEKRQAVISHAVARGMNPHVPMKPSGIEWLGDVPAHWEVRKLKSLSRLESGHTPSRQRPEYWVESECVIPWFTLADVGFLRDERNVYIRETSQNISPLGMDNSAARLLPIHTVILSRTASVGFTGVMAQAMAVSQDFGAWICGPQISPLYLFYCFRAMKDEFRRLMMGSTHQTIYMPDLEAFRVPVPPPLEQEAIAAHIGAETTRIDNLNTEAQRAVDLLQERRSALISAAVTGQIDVRNITHEDAA